MGNYNFNVSCEHSFVKKAILYGFFLFSIFEELKMFK